MIAQLLGHSDVRVTMRYVRSVEETKRVAVEAIKLSSRKVSTSWPQMNGVNPSIETISISHTCG